MANIKFKTQTVKGHGRGKSLGFPTINMIVPESAPLSLKQGVYAAKAIISGEEYSGMLYYGPALTFGETEPAFELYLFDTAGFHIAEHAPLQVEAVKFIRGPIKFELPELLIEQMQKDVTDIRAVLQK